MLCARKWYIDIRKEYALDRVRSLRNKKDLSLYIVHCNYNLYLLVIDTFIGRLLQLVASVSQAQI